MAPSPETADFDPVISPPEMMESYGSDDIQPFYVLHKASTRNPQRKNAARKIELSPSKPMDVAKSESYESFQSVWSKINSTIKDVLRDTNNNVFSEIHSWVFQSFQEITSMGVPTFAQATRSFPVVTNAHCNKIFTGLVLIKNMEFVDDLLTFEELGLCLKSHGCHVANMSSVDFTAKSGIGGCLRSLLRQLLMATLDTADMSVLASWYKEHGNPNYPIVIIIDDMERCYQSVLSDFILMLSEWVVKIPVILIMGVTTLDAPRSVLPAHTLQQLSPCKFALASPAEKMDAIIEASLLRRFSGFSIGHKVAVFLRNYFINQDGTLTSFIRALKIACAWHISAETLSFVLASPAGADIKDEEHALSLEGDARIDSKLARGLTELRRSQKRWSTVVLCLYEAGKYNKVKLLDLYCEALDPDRYKSMASDHQTRSGKGRGVSASSDNLMDQLNLRTSGPIYQTICKVRDLPASLLPQLLKSWEDISNDILEIHDKVKELQRTMSSEEGRKLKQEVTDVSKRQAGKDSKATNDGAASLIISLIRDFMKPVECVPFHEIICFKDVEKLQMALLGDPRRRIQVDLLEFQKFLQCSCCSKSPGIPTASTPDTSIMYMLAQEHGDLINLHDWYQSFKTTVMDSTVKPAASKRKAKQSPKPKTKKEIDGTSGSASIQARFCIAVAELQITGLIRLPSKRRPDYVQRVAFGL